LKQREVGIRKGQRGNRRAATTMEKIDEGVRDQAQAALALDATPTVSGAQQHVDGRVIANPISGERIIIRENAAQTGGRLLAFDLFLPPGGHVPARHVHPIQQEAFSIIEGAMRFRIGRFGGRAFVAHAGETVIVPPGTPHWFGNAGEETSLARVEVRPALRMEELFEMTEEIGQASGRGPASWLPLLADLARLVLEFQREVTAPDIPPFLVKAILGPLAQLGRRRVHGQEASC
jgi:quercetin dioxygenase-like cupin family protein